MFLKFKRESFLSESDTVLRVTRLLLKAVGDIEMLSKLRRGGEIQSETEKIDNDLKTKKNTLSSNEQKEKKLEGDMKIIDKREKIKEKKEIYIKALKWQKFKTLRAQVKETRDKKRDLDKQANDVEEKLIPTREFLKDYDKKVADIKADVDKLEKELQMVILLRAIIGFFLSLGSF